MGGSKKGGRPVYDWLMSIDYGVCWGPVDLIARVVVKDKNIFCGVIEENAQVIINQPDLFGGDDGEGGPVGIIECYLGTDDQVSSEALAERFGRTSDTMWGYRGLAHLFFRGGATDALWDGEPDEFPATVAQADRRGFRWTSNNPYLPECAVTVTCLPKLMGDTNHEIYPINGVTEAGEWEPAELYVTEEIGAQAAVQLGGYNGAPTVYSTVFDTWVSHPGDPNMILDLLDYFPNQEEIDKAFAAGAITLSGRCEGYVNDRAIVGGPKPGLASKAFGLNAFRDNGAGGPNLAVPMIADAGETAIDTGTFNRFFETTPVSVAGGIRYVKYRLAVYSASWQNTGFEYVGPGDLLGGAPRQTITLTYNKVAIAHCRGDGELGPMPNANPAHMIYEAMVNEDWGKGEDPALIDMTALVSAAATLKAEQFGLSLIWTAQDEIEKYIQNILDHIQASWFIHPRTGLWTIKLFRAEDASGAPILDPSNCRAMNRKRRAWDETINEIVVEWTEPRQEESATVSSHDVANISIQGGSIVSDTRQYFGIRDPYLAKWVADRDLRAASYPLWSAEVYMNRANWDVVPGQLFRFTWPEDGITEMVVRVMDVDYGKPGDREIKIAVIEDIFSLEQTTYAPPQTTQWTTTRNPPAPLDAEFAFTAPMPALIANGVDPVEFDAEYPVVLAVAFGWKDDRPVIDIALYTDVTLPNGSTSTEEVGRVPPTRSTLLLSDLDGEATSIIEGDVIELLKAGQQQPGDLILIGEAEDNHEIVMLDSYDSGLDEWTVERGIWDTIPQAWATGDRVWNMPKNSARVDPNERASGDALTYRFLPRMTEGRLAYDDASDVDYEATDRPHQPFRPADTEIEGNGFAVADYTGGGAPDPVSLTWANRNRLTEDSIYQTWEAANVTPEAGQTTTIRIYDALDDSLVHEVTGLSGTSTTIALSNFASYSYVEFVAERDGFESFRAPRRYIDLRQGYGENYGNDYGP